MTVAQTNDKRARQTALRTLIEHSPALRQQELALRLRRKGFHATQAGISRDLRELGLVKLNGRYVALDRDAGAARRGPAGLDSALVSDVSRVGDHLVVIRTPSGTANAVAVKLDAMNNADIAGTIAGDDTIFVAVASRAAQKRFVALLSPVERR